MYFESLFLLTENGHTTTEEMITASIYRQTFAKKVKWTALHFSLMDDRMSL